MITTPEITQDNSNSKTFATNWYDNVSIIFQLVISDYIWQKHGFDHPPFVGISKILQSETTGLYMEGENLIGAWEHDMENSKWIIYAKESY